MSALLLLPGIIGVIGIIAVFAVARHNDRLDKAKEAHTTALIEETNIHLIKFRRENPELFKD